MSQFFAYKGPTRNRFEQFMQSVQSKMQPPNFYAIVHLNREAFDCLMADIQEEAREYIFSRVFMNNQESGRFAAVLSDPAFEENVKFGFVHMQKFVVFEIDPAYIKPSVHYFKSMEHAKLYAASISGGSIYNIKALCASARLKSKRNMKVCESALYLPS